MLEKLTANLSGKPRYEMLNGRRHLVVPLSMLVPGVLNGSRGPLLYPLDEIRRDYDAWNGMPIVVNHPTDEGGNSVSARSPDILEKFGVGTVFSANVKNKLDALGWIDEEKGRKLIPNEFVKLEKGEPVELSTGLFTDNDPVKNGKALHQESGKEYVAIARNYRPDHLAILPNKKGACSIADGCGVNVNELNPDGDLTKYLTSYIDWDEPTENQLSHSDIRDRLDVMLRERHGNNCYIVEVYDKSVVYGKHAPVSSDGPHNPPKYYEIGYTSDLRSGKVQLSEDGAKEVMRETRYIPVTKNEVTLPWYKLIGNAGGNCGTGAGGFKPGNTCGGKGGGR